MNEASWLAAENPIPMLAFLNPGLAHDPGNKAVSARKLRLFACACSMLLPRRTLGFRRSVEAALAFADGELGAPEMEAARWGQPPGPWTVCNPDAGEAAYYVIRDDSFTGRRAEMAALLREVFGNPFRPVELRHLGNALCRRCHGAGTRPHVYPPAPCPACSCVTPAAQGIARRAYECHDFAALPILADALEEGGCEEETLLMHLRGLERNPRRVANPDADHEGDCWIPLRGPHVRGCWAADMVLGRA